MGMADHKMQTLPINQLQPNPFQPRSLMQKDDLDELVQSIKIFGVLEPLVVAETPAGYQIVAGERRWRAAKEAGVTEVPVVIKKTSPKGMLEMALVENVQRVDLSPLERAQAFQQLMTQFRHTIADLSEKIGKSKSYVTNTIQLLDLPDAIKDGLVSGAITEGHARAIGSIKDEKQMVECFKTILKEGASVRRAEELARRYRESQPERRSWPGRPKPIDDDLLNKWEKQFQSMFHCRTQFKLVRSERQTRVTFTFRGPPEATQKDIEKVLSFADLTPEES